MKQCSVCFRDFENNSTFCPYDGTRLIDAIKPGDAYIGATIDKKYHINDKIAEGGMGNVYRATHLQLNLTVAVKIMHKELIADVVAIERFRREAQAAMQIRHSNAITVMDFGVAQGNIVYLVMEYLQGCSLRQRVKDLGYLSVAEANGIMQQICAAVGAAHKRKIVHRDLKPDNIFLMQEASSEVVKVLDFGIAKLKEQDEQGKPLTRQGLVVGTPHYMSPEQCYAKETDMRSDIYSLGVILYEMLTGQTPFDANSPIVLAIKQASEQPRPLYELRADIPEAINTVVMHALQKQPQDRPQTVIELAQELEAAVKMSPSEAITRPHIDARLIDSELLGALPTEINPTPPQLMAPPPARKSSSTKNKALPRASGANKAIPEPEKGSTSQLEANQTNLLKEPKNTREMVKGQKSLWLPATKGKTYPVICEKCNQEVGRSLIIDSTIICPSCRTQMRRNKNSKTNNSR